jgi:hypothetical protein
MRVGSFVVEGVFIRENPAAAAVNMSGMCIVRCEYIYSADQFVYEAVCDEFDDVLPGETIPRYVIWIRSGRRVKVERKT